MYCVLYKTFPTIMCRESEWKVVVLHWHAVVSMFQDLFSFVLFSWQPRLMPTEFFLVANGDLMEPQGQRSPHPQLYSAHVLYKKTSLPLPSPDTSEYDINN